MRVSFVAAALASAALVFAQDESPVPGLPVCVFKCTDESAKSTGCGSYLNATCLCSSTEFQTAAGKCLAAGCTQEEQATAMTFQKATCDALAAGGNNGTDDKPTDTKTEPSPTQSGADSSPTSTDPPNAASRALALNGVAVVAAAVALVFAA